MPDWLRDTLLALGAFIGGRAVNGIGEQMREGRELRRGVDRLTSAVEGIGADLREIRGEIHGQVAGLKAEIHEQVSGLRTELHGYQMQQESRIANIEDRIDATNSRMDTLSSKGNPMAWMPPPRTRLNQEMGCYEPLGHDGATET